ncbi:MAG: membrane protein insertion efficiency factor YidD [Anaerolineales bacterium]
MTAELSHTHTDIKEQPSPSLKDLPVTFGNLPRFAILLPIVLYQKTLSRTLPTDTCRFYPSCSHYAYQAIYKYGAAKGGWMGFRRILRCNPLSKGGYDPVP